MMTAAIIASLINCSEPRIPFKEFYAQHFYGAPGGHWSGSMWEKTNIVLLRTLDATAAYIDYAEMYRDKCATK